MKGKHHEQLLDEILPFIAFYLGYYHTDYKAGLIFYVLWKIGTYLINCDLDTKSRSRKRLFIIGWIIDKCFKHRGTLHSVVFWSVLGGIGYYFYGWPVSGLIVPQYVHIATDKVF